MRETSEYYLLGFESMGQQQQGRHVELEVRVKRPGLTAKSRTGYLEQLDYRRRRRVREPERTAVEAALANPVATAGVPMRVCAAPFKQSGRNATVTLAVDLDASHLDVTRTGDTFSADVELRHLATDVNHRILRQQRAREA